MEIAMGAGTARLPCSLGCCLVSFAFRREPPATSIACANPVAAKPSPVLSYALGRTRDA